MTVAEQDPTDRQPLTPTEQDRADYAAAKSPEDTRAGDPHWLGVPRTPTGYRRAA